MIGVHPGPFTFGELRVMAEGAWDPFSYLIASWAGKKPVECNPLRDKSPTPLKIGDTKKTVRKLARLFGAKMEDKPNG